MKHTSEHKSGRRDLILIAAVLILALCFYIFNRFHFSGPAAVVEITVDGKPVQTLDLHKDQEITVNSITGGSNHLIIKDGKAWIDEASCPDKICIHQGKISRDGEMIVCLPNRMIAKITGE